MTVRSFCPVPLIAVTLVLPVALVQAGDGPTVIPIFSGSDGSSARIEVSRSGKRAIAVPVLEISGETVRRMAGTDERGSGPLAEVDGEEDRGRAVNGDFLTRHRSLLVREGPEGVSLGNGFDLLGDLQEALETMKGKREKPDGLDIPRNNPVRGSPSASPLPDTASPRRRPVGTLRPPPSDPPG